MNKFYIAKYKNLTKNLQNISSDLNLYSRINKFKKSKWKLLQNSLIKYQNSTDNFFLLERLYVKKYTWKKLRRNFKLGVNLKNFLNLYFNNSFSFKQYKNVFKFSNSSNFLFFSKLLFRIDIFLWKLNIFSSAREAKQFLFSRKIKLNDSIITQFCQLNKGDVIFLEDCFLTKTSFLYYNFFLSFCELDVYTNKIIILKNFNELSNEDFSLIFKNKIEFQALKQFFV
jgi:ribosomal protein S4